MIFLINNVPCFIVSMYFHTGMDDPQKGVREIKIRKKCFLTKALVRFNLLKLIQTALLLPKAYSIF